MPEYPFRAPDGEIVWEYFPMAERPEIGSHAEFPHRGPGLYERIWKVDTAVAAPKETLHFTSHQFDPSQARAAAEAAGITCNAHGEPQIGSRKQLERFTDQYNRLTPGEQVVYDG